MSDTKENGDNGSPAVPTGNVEGISVPEDKCAVQQKGDFIIISIPMDKTPRAMARGLLLEVDDILRAHYARMEAKKRETGIITPGSTGIKGKLAKIFK